MIVIVTPTPYGAYIFSAKSEKLRRRIEKHLKQFRINSDTAYAKSDDDLPDWVKPHHRKRMDAGWDVQIRVDTWEALHMWGWDTHTLAEG